MERFPCSEGEQGTRWDGLLPPPLVGEVATRELEAGTRAAKTALVSAAWLLLGGGGVHNTNNKCDFVRKMMVR